jgi:Tfp pilus assembly protein PilV
VNQNKGFTVAEILLALLLISVAILTLMALSLQSLSASRKSQDTLAGQLVAEQVLEKLVHDVETATSTSPFWAAPEGIYQNQVITQGSTSFNVTLAVSNITGQRLRLLQADVYWQDAPQGKARQGQLRVTSSRLIHEP